MRVVVLDGVTNLRSALSALPAGPPVRVLCDEGESAYASRVLGGPVAVCVRDLEDELLRAVGVDAAIDVVAAQGDLGSLRSLQQQPAQRDRPAHDQLRRFLGSGSGRKERYARLLAGRLTADAVPAPLRAVVSPWPLSARTSTSPPATG